MFVEYFEGVEFVELFGKDIFEEWLCKEIEKNLSFEECEVLCKVGGFEELMEMLKKCLEE